MVKEAPYLKNTSEHILRERILEAALSGAGNRRPQRAYNNDLMSIYKPTIRAYIIRVLAQEIRPRSSECVCNLIFELIQSFCHDDTSEAGILALETRPVRFYSAQKVECM